MARDFQLQNLIGKDNLESILEAFTQATGVASIITDVDGTPISNPHNFTPLCSNYCRRTDEGRQRCQMSDEYGGRESARSRRDVIYPCLNAGLLDSAAPIVVGGHHVGNTLCGQVLNAPIPSEEAVIRAKAIGVEDIEGYIEELSRIPIVDKARFQAIVRLMHVVTNTISELAYQKWLLSRRSRRYLEKLVNSVSEGIISTNRLGNITMVNDACENIFDAPKDRLVGRAFDTLLAEEDFILGVGNQLRSEIEGSVRAQVNTISDTGAQTPMQLSISKIMDENGQISDLVAVLRDISEEKRTEKMKEDLIGMMTHDLSNPVLSMQKALNLLLNDGLGQLNAAQKEMLEMTMQTGNQLYGMVTDFLDTYRHENGQFRLRKIDCDLIDLLHESIEQLSLFAKDKRITLTFNPPDGLTMCNIDFNRIKRVVINILENAIKYSPEEGVINVALERIAASDLLAPEVVLPEIYHRLAVGRSSYWSVSVADEGLGIPKRVVPYIFDKFFSASQRTIQGRKGTGLGLAYCKLAIEAHGGGIWVKSPLFSNSLFKFRGCRFNFLLPL
jgi:PAS domain S-box-containing protein